MPGCLALVHSVKKFHPDAKCIVVGYGITSNEITELETIGAQVIIDNEIYDPRLHGKARATLFGMLNAGKDKELLHIDSDAWLLAPVDNIFRHLCDDGMLAFHDHRAGGISAETIEELFGEKLKPIIFNAGIVFYKLGDLAKNLIHEFAWSMDNKRRQEECGNQPTLRILAAKYQKMGMQVILSHDAIHWNPIWSQAEQLVLEGEKWINEKTGKQQNIFHATGGKNRKKGLNKPWQIPSEWASSTLASFQWVGGILPTCDGSEKESSLLTDSSTIEPQETKTSS